MRPIPRRVYDCGASGSGHGSASSAASMSVTARFGSMYARGKRAPTSAQPRSGAPAHSSSTNASHDVRIACRGATAPKSGGYAMPLCGESTTIGSAASSGCATKHAKRSSSATVWRLNVSISYRVIHLEFRMSVLLNKTVY
ncbi:hypothetical protein X947_2539 [Burkholderia pseudomallei MSHR7334]|nr:hypothetical protein X947_2539 [Burkholderia pseudomallei MSHR7334]